MLRRVAIVVIVLAGLTVTVGLATATASERVQRDQDCADFPTQAAAQSYFEQQGGPASDPDLLDADGDGIACEANPCPCSTGGGGGGGGGGGTAPPPPPKPAPPPVLTEKICGKFVGVSGSRVCLKTVTQGEKLKKVEDFRFRGLPAVCGGSKPKLSGKDPKIDGDGKRFRSRHPKVLGSFSGVDAKVVGKIREGGKKARGDVRVRARNAADEACDTRARKWKAS